MSSPSPTCHRGNTSRRALGVVLLASLSCREAPPPSMRLLPRVLPTLDAPRPNISEVARKTWHLRALDIERYDPAIGVRVGFVRRHARLAAVPGRLRATLAPNTTAVRGWLAPQTDVDPPEGCSVGARITWGSVRAELDLPVRKDGGTWLPWQLSRPTFAVDELHFDLSPNDACAEIPITVAVSEVTPEAVGPAPKRDNVLLVVVDTMRRDLMDCAEVSRELTPNIAKRWCRHGAFFNSAYTTAPWTYPALGSLLTGLRPRDHGGEGMNRAARDINPHVTTLPEILRWHGYNTGAVISNWQAARGLWRGFDSFIELTRQGNQDVRRAGRVVDRTIAWLDQAPEPFFLWTLFIDLHEPVDAGRPKAREMPVCQGIKPLPVRWQGLGKPATPPTPDQAARIACRKALYRESMRTIDDHLGRLMDHLTARGLDQRTHIILVSDHGEELWDHAAEQRAAGEIPRGIWGIGHGHTLYSELIHVPLLIKPAGNRSPATEIDALVSIQDVFATVLGFAGATAPSSNPAHDLSRIFDNTAFTGRSIVTNGSIAYGRPRQAITTPDLRAIHTERSGLVVFDRRADPLERTPLSNDSPKVAGAKAELDRAFRRTTRYSAPSAADQEALRELGYIR